MTATIFNIDARNLNLFIEPGSVQTCVTSPPYFDLRSYMPNEHPDKALEIGLEETPDEYVARMVEVFRAVRDVLADDGTLWLNLGDSYGAGKQLLGVPWRLAFALQADGWILRQDIIWAKGVSGDAARAGWSGNPMPESVRDRCTNAHEYIFLLSKSPKYYFDHEAIKEDAVKGAAGSSFNKGKTATYQLGRSSDKERTEDGKRNKRSVWTVATRPYKGAHFATFPTALIEPCILAGSRPGDIVLDPFMGSGTTAQVALQHGRRAVGCELNPEYLSLIEQRLAA